MLKEQIKGYLVENGFTYKDLADVGTPTAISRKLRDSDPEVSFLSGLLNRIGYRLVIVDGDGKEKTELKPGINVPLPKRKPRHIATRGKGGTYIKAKEVTKDPDKD